MASDEDYMAFLNKANEDVGGGQSAARQQSGGGKAVFKALDEEGEVPKAIKDISPRPFYVSDADEPFEHVSLKWERDGGLPDEGTRQSTPSAPRDADSSCSRLRQAHSSLGRGQGGHSNHGPGRVGRPGAV